MEKQIDPVSDGVADIESFNGPIEVLRDQAVEWRFSEIGSVTAHDHDRLEFRLAAEKCVEESTKPSNGQEGFRRINGGRFICVG